MKKKLIFLFLIFIIIISGCSQSNINDENKKNSNINESLTTIKINENQKAEIVTEKNNNEIKDLDLKKQVKNEINTMIEEKTDLKNQVKNEVNNMINEEEEEEKIICNNECKIGEKKCSSSNNNLFSCKIDFNKCYNWELEEVCEQGCKNNKCIIKIVENIQKVDIIVENNNIENLKPANTSIITASNFTPNVNTMDDIEKAIESIFN